MIEAIQVLHGHMYTVEVSTTLKFQGQDPGRITWQGYTAKVVKGLRRRVTRPRIPRILHELAFTTRSGSNEVAHKHFNPVGSYLVRLVSYVW